MHELITDRLEEILSGSISGEDESRLREHLDCCEQCRNAVALMREQAQMLRSWQAPQEIEPPPGFYARVMGRIEAQARSSVWYLFVESHFARRIAFASLLLAILMGTYLVGTEPAVLTADRSDVVVNEDGPAPVLAREISRDRDAVLVNLATYQEQ